MNTRIVDDDEFKNIAGKNRKCNPKSGIKNNPWPDQQTYFTLRAEQTKHFHNFREYKNSIQIEDTFGFSVLKIKVSDQNANEQQKIKNIKNLAWNLRDNQRLENARFDEGSLPSWLQNQQFNDKHSAQEASCKFLWPCELKKTQWIAKNYCLFVYLLILKLSKQNFHPKSTEQQTCRLAQTWLDVWDKQRQKPIFENENIQKNQKMFRNLRHPWTVTTASLRSIQLKKKCWKTWNRTILARKFQQDILTTT